MSQQLFADRLGKSKSWVDKVERGIRRLDRLSVIDEIAAVLQLDVRLLTDDDSGKPMAAPNGSDQDCVEALRVALERYDKIMTTGGNPESVVPTLGELTKSVAHAWHTYQHSSEQLLARLLPGLLNSAQTADAYFHADDLHGEDARRSAGLLGEVYQIAASCLLALGEHGLAWLAAERAVTASHRAQDELLLASSIGYVAAALAELGRLRPAFEIGITAAGRVAPRAALDVTPQRLSVYGYLLLQTSMTAARLGEVATVEDLLTAAEEPAAQLGRDDSYLGMAFGPTLIAMHRVAACVELGEAARALMTNDQIAPTDFAAMTAVIRARHLVTVARAFNESGDDGQATKALVEASRLAPREVRRNPATSSLVEDIVRRTRGGAAPALAELVAIPVPRTP